MKTLSQKQAQWWQHYQIARMSRAQLLGIVRDPLAPAERARLAYQQLEGME